MWPIKNHGYEVEQAVVKQWRLSGKMGPPGKFGLGRQAQQVKSEVNAGAPAFKREDFCERYL